MVSLLLTCLVLAQNQILIEPRIAPWESAQACYIDSLYVVICPQPILEIYLTAENETLNLGYKTDFNHPDTHYLILPKRMSDFRTNLVIKTDSGIISQRLRLYKGERRIIVYRDIRPQKMLVFEADSLIAEFLVSTGRKGRQTALGEHKILTKRYRAWFRERGLWMTWWQSFDIIGGTYNGMHALEGERYEKLLGSPASAGCIRVSRQDGKWLFEWTDVGIDFAVRSKP